MSVNWQQAGYCWLGGTRYHKPLNPTQEKKWRLLASLNIDMHVIAFSTTIQPRHFTHHAHFYLLPLLPLSFLRYLLFFITTPLLLIWVILRHRVNVVIAQSPYEGAVGAFVRNLLRLFNRKIVLIVESHGDFEVSVFIQRKIQLKRLYQWFMTRFARYALQNADVIRIISSMTRRQIEQWTSDKPIVEIVTWTDADIFLNTPRQHPLDKTQDVMYTGVLIPRKGVHFLLPAFAEVVAKYHKAQLWLVGAAENEAYTTQLHRQVKELDLNGRVHFVGAVSQKELAEYFGRVRVNVLPSISEGLGRVVVEAMMCSTPVIGSDVGGIPDMIRDGENGYLVPPGDVDALTDALMTVMDHPNINELGQNARQFAENFFSPEQYCQEHQKLFELACE